MHICFNQLFHRQYRKCCCIPVWTLVAKVLDVMYEIPLAARSILSEVVRADVRAVSWLGWQHCQLCKTEYALLAIQPWEHLFGKQPVFCDAIWQAFACWSILSSVILLVNVYSTFHTLAVKDNTAPTDSWCAGHPSDDGHDYLSKARWYVAQLLCILLDICANTVSELNRWRRNMKYRTKLLG